MRCWHEFFCDENNEKINWETKKTKRQATMKRKIKWWAHCDCLFEYGYGIWCHPVKYIAVLSQIEYYILKAMRMAFPAMFDWTINNCTNSCNGNCYPSTTVKCGLHSDNEP